MKNKIIFILLCCVAIALFADDGVLLLFRNDGKIEAFETQRSVRYPIQRTTMS